MLLRSIKSWGTDRRIIGLVLSLGLWVAISDVVCYLLHIEGEIGLPDRLLLLKHFVDVAARLYGAGPFFLLHRGQVAVVLRLAFWGFFGRFQPQVDLILPIYFLRLLKRTRALIIGHD